MLTPSVVTVVRIKKRRAAEASFRVFWSRQREFLRAEATRGFVVELLVFGLLAALSVWAFLHTVAAMRLL